MHWLSEVQNDFADMSFRRCVIEFDNVKIQEVFVKGDTCGDARRIVTL